MKAIKNQGGQRGSTEVDSKFMNIFEEEQGVCRKLGPLEPRNANDFVLKENETYAMSVLKNFLLKRKISLD